jgi:hypothetical protein
MDRGSFCSVQQPLKDRYRNDPGAARVTLHAEGVLGRLQNSSIDWLSSRSVTASFTKRCSPLHKFSMPCLTRHRSIKVARYAGQAW